jgi:arylsulfatase A-like enzyme
MQGEILPGSADPLRGYKTEPYEGGHRVPCIMRWPDGIPSGTACNELATSMDIFVTLSAIAGVPIPTDRVIDGYDIRPLITAQPGVVTPYTDGFLYYKGKNIKAIRRGDWKYFQGKEPELYNLATDIDESDNLVAQYPDLANELKNLLWDKVDEINANTRPQGTITTVRSYDRARVNGLTPPVRNHDFYYDILGRRVRGSYLQNSSSKIYFQMHGKKRKTIISK